MYALLYTSIALLPQLRVAPASIRAPVARMIGEERVEQIVDASESIPSAIFGTSKAVEDAGLGSALVPLRIATGILMIHHGSEGGILPANYGTDGFQGFVDFIVKPYFGFLPGEPELWSAIHDYIEWFGGLFVAIGFLTRFSSLLLAATMVGAVYFHLASTGLQGFPLGHVENYSYNFEEPALYLLIFFLLSKTGSGGLSVDEKIAGIFKED